MFRQGKPRAFIHNLRLAVMLSFVAGIVNIAGVLSISTLTTNVTGHFAFFAEELMLGEYAMALTFIAYIISFLLGAMTCGLMVESVLRKYPDWSHGLPMITETAILVLIGLAFRDPKNNVSMIACALLFAMGMQNALVTKVSSATVRTTHLTGLFTDLGIEFAQLFFHREAQEVQKLRRSIYLRLGIIVFFFIGGVTGGLAYKYVGVRTLLLAAVVLILALLYDSVRKRFSMRHSELN